MPQNISRSSHITYLVVVSFLGLSLAGMLTIFPPNVRESLPWRKPLIGSIFGLICVFGILAAFCPKRCSRVFDFGKKKPCHPYLVEVGSHGTSSMMQGHHPDCGSFGAHVFQIGHKTYCAACTGLFLGGLSAFVGSFLYFFTNLRFEPNSFLIVWLGILGVGFGLFQFKFRSFIRLFLNVFFVLGAFLVLIGVDRLVQSVAVNLFLVALILFWLFTRVLLSQWDHQRLCYDCKVTACEFADRKKEGRLLSAAIPVEGSGNNQYSKDDYNEWPYVSSNIYSRKPRDPCKYYYYAND